MIVRDYREVEAQEFPGVEGVTVRWVINEDVGAPRFAMRVFDVQPGAATPYHQHWFEHEVYVLDGTGSIRAEDGRKPVGPGSTAFIPSMEWHQFVNEGEDVLRFICVIPLDWQRDVAKGE